MALVAGIDSSTQSCKVVIRDVDTGDRVRTGSAPHPAGTEVHPQHWWSALLAAIEDAGGLADVSALAVAGQQHGMVCLDTDGTVIRPALLWNDTRSARAAEDLIAELGQGDRDRGALIWAQAVGTVPVASLTVTKLRWLVDHEPDNAARVAAVALPHDWLTWRLSGATALDTLVTDRSDASGTGYFDASTGSYRRDLLAHALRRPPQDVDHLVLPRVLGPAESVGQGAADLGLGHVVLAPGCGDNAAAALALGLKSGQTSLSLGTSGVVAMVSTEPFHDATGQVSGFADATGKYLGLAVTLNSARILDAAATVLDVDHEELSHLALAAAPGSGGLVHVPYLDGERTPNLPNATGSLLGMTSAALTRENYARSAVEGLLCLMADAIAAVAEQGIVVDRVALIGGAARSQAVQQIAPQILGLPVDVHATSEYAADGAALQAAWVLTGGHTPPSWAPGAGLTVTASPAPGVLDQYRRASALLHPEARRA